MRGYHSSSLPDSGNALTVMSIMDSSSTKASAQFLPLLLPLWKSTCCYQKDALSLKMGADSREAKVMKCKKYF